MEFPQPEIGLVISYSYLWSDEAEAGHVEGRKNRPCTIALVVQQAEVLAAAPKPLRLGGFKTVVLKAPPYTMDVMGDQGSSTRSLAR